jgi:transposase
MSQKDRDRLKVLHEAEKGTLTQKQAGVQLKLSERWVRKLLVRLREEGDGGILHRLRGRASKRRLPEAVRQKVVKIVKREYADFGPTLAAEYLAEQHGIQVSKETLRHVLMAAGCGSGSGGGWRRCTSGEAGGPAGGSWCNGTRRSMTGWRGGGRSSICWP